MLCRSFVSLLECCWTYLPFTVRAFWWRIASMWDRVEHNSMMLPALDRLATAKEKNIWIPCVRCWRGWHLLSEETGNLIIDKIWSRSPGQWFCLWTLLTVRPLISSRSGSSDGPPALCLVHCYEQNTKMFDCETCCSGLWQQCSLCSIQKS